MSQCDRVAFANIQPLGRRNDLRFAICYLSDLHKRGERLIKPVGFVPRFGQKFAMHYGWDQHFFKKSLQYQQAIDLGQRDQWACIRRHVHDCTLRRVSKSPLSRFQDLPGHN